MSTLFAFWTVSLLLVLTPGLDWAYAIQAGSRGRSFQGVSGLLLGHILITVTVAAGFGTIIAHHPAIMHSLIALGSVYLLWVGLGMILHPSAPAAQEAKEIVLSSSRWVFKGIGVSGLNPKVVLLLLALLPQFIDSTSTWSALTQITLLGAVHILNCTAVYYTVGYSSQKILRSRPQAARMFSRVSGSAMILVTCFMIFEQVG